MSKREFYIVLVVLGFLIVVFGYLNFSIKNDFKIKRDEYLNFEQNSYQIFQIKRMQKKVKATINSLKNIKQPKISKRTNSTVYSFENLNLNDLNLLLKKIKGSFLPIKKLEIKRDTTNHATIILEVARWKRFWLLS